jgi:enoyl-CoA hydratase/carnithine racemase
MTDHVRVALEQGILTLTLNRPEKKNALTQAMYAALSDALSRAETDPATRVIVFRAEGDAFTSGNDLDDFMAVASGRLKREEMKSVAFLIALARAQKPLIAAVQGLAVGVGVTMLLHCDFAYVADDAKLSTPFVNLGLVPEAASSLLLPARIGYARAFQLFALGEPILGRDAAAIGLVTSSAPAGEVGTLAMTTAKKLVGKPLGALRAMKGLMRDPAAIEAAMQREGEIFSARLKSPEAAEAFKAFVERRAPDFSKFA